MAWAMAKRAQRSSGRSTLAIWFLVTLLMLSFGQVALAAGNITIDDPDNLLGNRRGEVEAAARRLADAGADVIIMLVRNDGGAPNDTPSADRYVNDRLTQIGMSGTVRSLPGNAILFYRSPDAQHSALYYVPGYKPRLDPELNRIFTEQMRPLFTTGDTAGGLIAGMDAVRTTLNPPTSPFTYALVGAAVLGGLALLIGPQLRRRRAVATELATARDRMEQARRAAGAAIADLGQLLRSAREKAQYDRLSYSPADTQRVTALQQAGEQVFAQAQAAFDQAEQAQRALATPTPPAYDQIAASFAEAQRLTDQAAASINEAEQLRATLDQTAGPQGPATGTTRLL